ncbi:MAG: hypothetical protein WC506_00510 [Candidatus Micrarchaeia archaeon]
MHKQVENRIILPSKVPMHQSRHVRMEISRSSFFPGEKSIDLDFFMHGKRLHQVSGGLVSAPKRHAFSAPLPDFLSGIGSTSNSGRLGYIQYETVADSNAAISLYYPRDNAHGYSIGIGYYFEKLSCHYLVSRGFETVSSKPKPSSARVKQLERVGLPIGMQVGLAEWMKAMDLGLEMAYDFFMRHGRMLRQ